MNLCRRLSLGGINIVNNAPRWDARMNKYEAIGVMRNCVAVWNVQDFFSAGQIKVDGSLCIVNL